MMLTMTGLYGGGGSDPSHLAFEGGYAAGGNRSLTGDFRFEVRFRLRSNISNQVIVGSGLSDRQGLTTNASGFCLIKGTAGQQICSGSALVLNTWYVATVGRSGTTLNMVIEDDNGAIRQSHTTTQDIGVSGWGQVAKGFASTTFLIDVSYLKAGTMTDTGQYVYLPQSSGSTWDNVGTVSGGDIPLVDAYSWVPL